MVPVAEGKAGVELPTAEQTALPSVGEASMQRAPRGGSLRLSLQLPGWRLVPLQRRMMGELPLPEAQ